MILISPYTVYVILACGLAELELTSLKYVPGSTSKVCDPVAVNAPELAAAKLSGEVGALVYKVQVAELNDPVNWT